MFFQCDSGAVLFSAWLIRQTCCSLTACPGGLGGKKKKKHEFHTLRLSVTAATVILVPRNLAIC